MEKRLESISLAVNNCCLNLARPPLKGACAEFFATFVLVVLGDGVMATCILGQLESHSVLVGALGWGFALMIAVAIAGGVSGGHVNPAVTVGLAVNKKCPWKNALYYITAQYLSSFLAAACVYFTYLDAINHFDGGIRLLPPALNSTAEIFATYPQEFASIATCIWDQVIASALLLIIICAATDERNLRVPPHTQPLIIGLGLSAIVFAFGLNCGAPLNPARDLAPRLFTAICGWGTEVFSYRNYEWFWIPILAPHIGGVIGVWLYKILIELPFKNYSRVLEIESLENSMEDQRRRQACYDVQRQLLDRSLSGEYSKNVLPGASLTSAKVTDEASSVLSQRKSKQETVDKI